MLNESLPKSFIRDMNDRMANYIQALGERMVEDRGAAWAVWWDADEEEAFDDDGWEEFISEIWDNSFDKELSRASQSSSVACEIHRLCEEKLYDPDNSPSVNTSSRAYPTRTCSCRSTMFSPNFCHRRKRSCSCTPVKNTRLSMMQPTTLSLTSFGTLVTSPLPRYSRSR